MKRKEFLRKLKVELRKRRDIEVEEVLFYYDELIQDAVDNGESEEVFIMNLGSLENIRKRIVDEEEFINEVREKNDTIVKEVLSTTVKGLAYFVFGIIAFTLIVTAASVFFGGVAVILSAVTKIILTTPSDIYGYLAMLGVVMVGVSLILISVATYKWLYEKSKPALLNIFRRINELLNRKGN